LLSLSIFIAGPCYAQAREADSGNYVKVHNNRLSVQAKDAEFEKLMTEIAGKAGFEVSINPEVSDKVLSTDFQDVELQRGIQRLMALIRHSNYFIYYRDDGSIRKLEVYGSQVGSSPGRKPAGSWTAPPGAAPPRPPVILPNPGSMRPGAYDGRMTRERGGMPYDYGRSRAGVPPEAGQTAVEPYAEMEEPVLGAAEEDTAGGAPRYIPPSQAPVFIPPR